MAFAAEIKVNDERVARMLKSMTGRAGDLTTPFKAGGAHMLRSIQQNFERGGRPERWRPWAPSTVESYEREGTLGRRSVLRHLGLRGGLLGSIATKATKTSLIIGSAKPYAGIHQRGGRAGRGHATVIPARPYMVVHQSDQEILSSFISEYLLGA